VFGDVQMLDVHNFRISVHVLRGATKNIAQGNMLGRGGFGVVYKGELHDGVMIAVKRMESAVVSNKASGEFQAEIAVLTKVRHCNLVSILGYSTEGIEKLQVWCMNICPNGALRKHLFHWKQFELEPLMEEAQHRAGCFSWNGVSAQPGPSPLHSLGSQISKHSSRR
jgi:hypothetical protein